MRRRPIYARYPSDKQQGGITPFHPTAALTASPRHGYAVPTDGIFETKAMRRVLIRPGLEPGFVTWRRSELDAVLVYAPDRSVDAMPSILDRGFGSLSVSETLLSARLADTAEDHLCLQFSA